MGVYFTEQANLLAKIEWQIGGAGGAVGSETNGNSVILEKLEGKRFSAKPFVGCGAMDKGDPAFLEVGQIGGLQLVPVGKNRTFGESLVFLAPCNRRLAISEISAWRFFGEDVAK